MRAPSFLPWLRALYLHPSFMTVSLSWSHRAEVTSTRVVEPPATHLYTFSAVLDACIQLGIRVPGSGACVYTACLPILIAKPLKHHAATAPTASHA